MQHAFLQHQKKQKKNSNSNKSFFTILATTKINLDERNRLNFKIHLFWFRTNHYFALNTHARISGCIC